MKYYCHNGGCKFDCSVEITENIEDGRKIAPPLNCLQWENGYPQTVESPAWRTHCTEFYAGEFGTCECGKQYVLCECGKCKYCHSAGEENCPKCHGMGYYDRMGLGDGCIHHIPCEKCNPPVDAPSISPISKDGEG